MPPYVLFLPMRRLVFPSGSRRTAGAHRVEVAVPADSPECASLFEGRGFGGQGSQREVDGLAPGGELVAAHHLGARLLVNVYVGAVPP